MPTRPWIRTIISTDESILMRPSKCGTVYEYVATYVATYVDDLCICAKEPEELLKRLQGAPYKFDLKGSGPLNFHLGCGFYRNKDGRLCIYGSKQIHQ